MKVAIVHEMLIKLGGAENVVLDILDIFPDADIFTLLYDEKKVGTLFPKSRIKYIPQITQRIYNLIKNQRFLLPFMPRAVESIDLSEYDLVIASSSAFAHGCITKPETPFVVYYHSPARYLWDYTFENRKDLNYKSWFKKPLLVYLSILFTKLRVWDFQAGQRHDLAIAASKQVRQRISKYYRRDSKVIYPAVYCDDFEIGEAPLKERDFYVVLSALTEFKKVEIAVKGFNEMGLNLKIIGVGLQEQYLKKIAKDNIEFLGRKTHDEMREIYKNAKGFIMCCREDFGIAPIEAMAAGMPVFALSQGGLTETSMEGLTGEFFDDPQGSDFIEKFKIFDENINNGMYDRIKIRDHALNFRKERFIEEFKKILSENL